MAGLSFREIAHGTNHHFIAIDRFGNYGAGKGDNAYVFLRGAGPLRRVQFQGRLGFMEALGIFRIKVSTGSSGDVYQAEERIGFHYAVPGEKRKGIGIGGDVARRLP